MISFHSDGDILSSNSSSEVPQIEYRNQRTDISVEHDSAGTDFARPTHTLQRDFLGHIVATSYSWKALIRSSVIKALPNVCGLAPVRLMIMTHDKIMNR